jgi:Fur family peroxide stress response transcriptional regulator
METKQARIDELVIKLREQGLRLTPQRLAVLKTVIGSQEHLSADEIYARLRVDYPMIGLATVYKTLSVLKEMGEIAVLNFDNQGARYDGSGLEPHPHFICKRCNAIIDLEEEALENLTLKIASKSGYQITDYRLDFFGICPNCQSE